MAVLRPAGGTVAEVEARTRWLCLALLGWTLFVWGNRVANALSNDEGAGALVLSGLMAVATGAYVAGLVRSWRAGPDEGAARLLLVLPALTVPVWVVRGADIATSGHEAPFVVVHLVLAAISIALSVLVWRALGGVQRSALDIAA